MNTVTTMPMPRGCLRAWTIGVVVFILAPIVMVLLVSLTPTSHISLPTSGLSLRWFKELLNYPEFGRATLNSLLLATEAAVSALLIGLLTALAVVRYSFRLRAAISMMAISPLFVPMVMSGLAILIFFTNMGWSSQPLRLYVAHVGLTIPYVIRTVTASMSSFDMNQELAARNLGASPLRAFWHVTLPQLGPGFLAGAMFAFIVSLDNVGLSLFLTGSQFSTLPVELYAYASYNNDPMASAISVLLILFSLGAIALLERVFGIQKLLTA